MKKILALVLALMLVAVFTVSCGQKAEEAPTAEAPKAEEKAEEPAKETEEASDEEAADDPINIYFIP